MLEISVLLKYFIDIFGNVPFEDLKSLQLKFTVEFFSVFSEIQIIP